MVFRALALGVGPPSGDQLPGQPSDMLFSPLALMEAEETCCQSSEFLKAWEWHLGDSCSLELLYSSGEISGTEISCWCSGFLMVWERCLGGSFSLKLFHVLYTLSEPKKMSCLSSAPHPPTPRTGRAPYRQQLWRNLFNSSSP